MSFNFYLQKINQARRICRHKKSRTRFQIRRAPAATLSQAEQALAISPIDGRYKNLTRSLENYFSEFALMRYRVKVEILYFIKLVHLLHNTNLENLKHIYQDFSMQDYLHIKKVEQTTHHDIKAVEYFIQNKIRKTVPNAVQHLSFVHFGLTSQDINNTALSISLKEYTQEVYVPSVCNIIKKLNDLSQSWRHIIMIGRTHGQPATPTSLGKEVHVFVYRLNQQLRILKTVQFWSKFGGATGNLNAHYLAYPENDWVQFSTDFLEQDLRLCRSEYTTQIDSYDSVAVLCDAIRRINTILLDLVKDLWLYISYEYISQQQSTGQIGSSTMPHKINPINFENAEGNLTLANTMLELFARKLPISRLQRDLTDSTVCRNFGQCFGYVQVAYAKLLRGLGKISANKSRIAQDLKNNKVVMAEGLQTLMRARGDTRAYEKVKKAITEGNLHHLFEQFNLLQPHLYVGTATQF